VARLENQLEQGDNHDQANQKDDTDGAAQELKHCESPVILRLKTGTAARHARFVNILPIALIVFGIKLFAPQATHNL